MKPLLRAEQAVLGAVLLDPAQMEQLASWLEPDHFYRPAHQAVYAAMLKLRAVGHAALRVGGEVPLAWLTDIYAEASRTTRGLTPFYLHTLVSACPRAGNAAVYGRMVLEGAIHRTVFEHATRLRQATRRDTVHGVEGTLHQLQVLEGALDDLSRRWGTEPRPVPPNDQHAAAVHTPVAEAGQADEEEQLVALLVDRPEAIGDVVAWLRPEDFADPGLGELYRCLGALHHRGEPIDALTVQWEAQRRGLFADGTLMVEQVDQICDGIGAGPAEFLGERIVGSALARTASSSARAIQRLAGDDSLPPGRLIGHALHILQPVDEIRQRWRAATGTTPPPAASSVESQAARVQAALARSQPNRPGAPATPAPPPEARAAPSPARIH